MSFRDTVTRLRLTPAAGVLLAVVLAAPSTVRASCGDYVPSHPIPQPSPPASMPNGRHVSDGQHVPDAPWQGPRPCHGPQCTPSNPVSQAVLPPTLPELDQWAWVAALRTSARPIETGLLVWTDLPPLAPPPSPIYHPPR
jgi:hypothetical protein